jgi:hypothetical protein
MLFGGLAGVIGFELPLARGHALDGSLTSSISALDIATGTFHAHARYRGVTAARAFAALAFAPALFLLAIGAVGVARGRLPRTVGGIAMLLGVVSAALWSVLLEASFDADAQLGPGAHALLVAGLAGMAAGVSTILTPSGGTSAAAQNGEPR